MMSDCIMPMGGHPLLMVPYSTMGRRYVVLCAVAAIFVSVPYFACAQQNVTVGETPQQVNDRIRTLTMGSKSSAPHDYVIGRGDLLDISVFDVPELSKEVRVSQTGTINIPLIPVRPRVAESIWPRPQGEQYVANRLAQVSNSDRFHSKR